MEISKAGLIAKVRLAIDEIAGGRQDDFTMDADKEIGQAVEHAMVDVLQSVPLGLVAPKRFNASLYDKPDDTGINAAQCKNVDGTGYVVLPDDFLRLVEFRLESWMSPARTPIKEDSEEALLQSTPWGRGTPQKPKVMLSTDELGNRILRYWTAGRYNKDGMTSTFNHKVQSLLYVPVPKFDTTSGTLNMEIRANIEKSVVYGAAALFLEAKKETALAERMRNIASNRVSDSEGGGFF